MKIERAEGVQRYKFKMNLFNSTITVAELHQTASWTYELSLYKYGEESQDNEPVIYKWTQEETWNTFIGRVFKDIQKYLYELSSSMIEEIKEIKS